MARVFFPWRALTSRERGKVKIPSTKRNGNCGRLITCLGLFFLKYSIASEMLWLLFTSGETIVFLSGSVIVPLGARLDCPVSWRFICLRSLPRFKRPEVFYDACVVETVSSW